VNYIGSKRSLLPHISALLDRCAVPSGGLAIDAFAGTGAVASMLKQRGHTVWSNDLQQYSAALTTATVVLSAPPVFSDLCLPPAHDTGHLAAHERVLHYLNQIPGSSGAFFEAYACGGRDGRCYFSPTNGLRIQAIRDQIEHWYQTQRISDLEQTWLVACLLEAADRTANTASVYAAFLKRLKPAAQRPLVLRPFQPVATPTDAAHQVFCLDAAALLQKASQRAQLVYFDPPYTARRYDSYYHLLETLARWDVEAFTPRGVAGLRPDAGESSAFCATRTVETAFRTLFGAMDTNYWLLSYSSDGLLDLDTLLAIARAHSTRLWLAEVPTRRFRADTPQAARAYRSDRLSEYLLLGATCLEPRDSSHGVAPLTRVCNEIAEVAKCASSWHDRGTNPMISRGERCAFHENCTRSNRC
jgi:adenine-specific DNA-methyltransferase